MKKVCSKCGVEKESSEFHKQSSKQDGLRPECKKCRVIKTADKPGNYKHGLTHTKEYVAFHHRKYTLKKKFGITPEQYEVMHNNQKGLCYICGQPETVLDNKYGTPKKLAVDHCHKTNKVRRLLCNRCNTTLGKVNEDKELLRRMINYLEAI